MLASMYSAVSGLSVHKTKMDVIGNNISNVNTYGFKGSRIVFSDIFYQNYSGASAPTTTTGGTNASQLGYGASVGSIDVVNSRGGKAATDRSLDVYINGEGYLPVQDSSGNTLYTRLGSLGFDKAGQLVDPNGNRVLGIPIDENGVVQLQDDGTTTTSSLVPINVDPEILKTLTSISIGTKGQITAIKEGGQKVNLAAGTNWIDEVTIPEDSLYSGSLKIKKAVPAGATMANNPADVVVDGLKANGGAITTSSLRAPGATATLDANKAIAKLGNTREYYTASTTDGTNWTIADANGTVKAVNVTTAALGTDYGLTVTTPSAGDSVTFGLADSAKMQGDVKITDANGTLEYTYVDAQGNVKKETATPANTAVDTPAAGKTTFTYNIPFVDGNTTNTTPVTVEVDTANILNGYELGTVVPETVDFTATVYNKAGIEQELNGQWNATDTTSSLKLGDMTMKLNPKKLGNMDYGKLDNKQIGNVGASDGTVITIGNLSMATFINMDGLSQQGEGYYLTSSNSGPAIIAVPGNNGTGTVAASALEMSNVDLAAEFTEMIFAQRGFQANSRVITTSDTLLEELVNLVR